MTLTERRTRVTKEPLVTKERSLSQSYPAVAGSVPRARNDVVAFAAQRGATERQLEAIRLAVSEAVSNAVVHAYNGAGDGDGGRVHVTAQIAARELWILVSDEGRGFQAPAHKPGLGWGLPLIAHMSDRLEIAERAEGGTEIRMRFPLEPAA
jgi:anti-sigma regulatory factor (Ser/Thr protein kinase)